MSNISTLVLTKFRENRLFPQFYSPQTAEMKDQILQELGRSYSKLRVVLATVAMSMGVDIPAIRNIIHIGSPRTIREYMQETGRACRDGSSSAAYLNNRDIVKNKKGISEEIRDYCHLKRSCMRKYLLDCLDAGLTTKVRFVGHLCCRNCRSVCGCDSFCK
jgi:superfamily II DNA helicase RecQ